MFKSITLEKKHYSLKINGSFVKQFTSLNRIPKYHKGDSKAIYNVNGIATAIVAYSTGYEARQLDDNISQVICYSDTSKEWRLFVGDEIVRGRVTRRDVAQGKSGRNCKLIGGSPL